MQKANEIAELQRPATPTALVNSLPASLRPLLNRTNLETGEFQLPNAISTSDLETARRELMRLERGYRTAPRDWIAGRVATLLLHYWTDDNPRAVVEKLAADWVEVLAGFSEATLARAAQRYLTSEPRKRPTPGAVRELAVMLAEPEWHLIERLRRLTRCPIARTPADADPPPRPVRTAAMMAWENACMRAARDATEAGRQRLERLLSMRTAIEAGAEFVEISDEVAA